MVSVGACEAVHRLFDFEMSSREPSVTALPVHLENGQRVYFRSGEAHRVLESGPPETPLTAWFRHNEENSDQPIERQFLYTDFPGHYIFDEKAKKWNPRKRSQGDFRAVGRVHTVHPSAGDLFYLRILLHKPHAKGKRSFADLRTVDNVEHDSFKSACLALGLLQDDSQWDAAMQDAALTKLCPQMRAFFILTLEFNDPADPTALFERHWRPMADDFLHRAEQAIPDDVLRTMVLIDLDRRARTRSKCLSDYKLPAIDDASRAAAEQVDERMRIHQLPQLIQEELSYDNEEQQATADRLCSGMLASQRTMVDAVLNAAEVAKPYAVFVDAPGGTGKTFCFNAILAAVRAKGKAALAVASRFVFFYREVYFVTLTTELLAFPNECILYTYIYISLSFQTAESLPPFLKEEGHSIQDSKCPS